MAAPLWKAYTNAVHRDLHYLVTWAPDRQLKVGDVVIMQKDRSLERQTTLEKLGIPYEVTEESRTAPMFYVSRKGLSVEAHADAQPGVETVPVEAKVDL